jgi:LacI family transcriptional regulator
MLHSRQVFSTVTVSRVLKNVSVVEGSMRTKVLKAVEDLKYFAQHPCARVGGRDCTDIGVACFQPRKSLFSGCFPALDDEAREKGFEVLIANTDYDPVRLVSSVQLMLGRRAETEYSEHQNAVPAWNATGCRVLA